MKRKIMLLIFMSLFLVLLSSISAHGDAEIIVAVIDTGIDKSHDDLKSYIWINRGEIPGNGVDDDKNGFIDDVYGWNFAGNSPNVKDTHGHGTHVSGLVVKNFGNTKGLKIMTLKYYQEGLTGVDHLKFTVNAINYAVKMGAHIINYSGGGLRPHGSELQALKTAQEKNILFVAAAGNESHQLSDKPFFPAGYGLPNILSVAAMGTNNQLFKHSNFDSKLVHLAAPGQNVSSTLPNNSYGTLSGTSQATAIVSGVAAQLLKADQWLSPQQIIQRLVRSGSFNPKLISKTKDHTELSQHRALMMKTNETNAAGVPIVQSQFQDIL